MSLEPAEDPGIFRLRVAHSNLDAELVEELMGGLDLDFPLWEKDDEHALFRVLGESRARMVAKALCLQWDSWQISLPPSVCPHARTVRVDMRTNRVVCETCGATGKLTPVIRTGWDGSTAPMVDWRWQGQPPMKLREDG